MSAWEHLGSRPVRCAVPGLRAARERKGITAKALGLAVGVLERTVLEWERGNRAPNGATRQALAERLGCSEASLEEVPE